MKEKYGCTPILHIIIDGFGGWRAKSDGSPRFGLVITVTNH
jgi:hypothetical protein